MTEQHDTFDRFDDLLAQSLQGDEQPSPDFTARVMAEVRTTSQRKRRSPYLKAVAGLAACAAIVILAIPLLSPKGSMAPAAADCAASEEADCEAIICDDAGEDSVAEAESEPAHGTPQVSEEAKDTAQEELRTNMTLSASQKNDCDSIAVLCPDEKSLCDEAAVWLTECGIEPQEDGLYHLSTETAAALAEAIPELNLPEGEVILDLNK